MSPSGFDALHEKVREWIWREGWTSLRDIQEEAIQVLLGSSETDLVISSATASGKTEAAFLPIASRILEDGLPGLRVIYVSPLKALINDQHRRLEALFEPMQVPVHRWHGDVSASAKRKVLENPRGVLLITPESLEALFIRQGPRIPALARSLAFVVVDELHAFIGAERGRQLQSLLHRLEVAAGGKIPRVALSATLGDMGLACDFLRPGAGEDVRLVRSDQQRQEVKIQLRGYEARARPSGHEEDGGVPGDAIDVSQDLFRLLRGGRHLVFANRRADVETYADLLRRAAEDARVPNEFWAHHGSLSKELREDAEAALRDGTKPTTVIATTTLELGIDVGSVESIAQVGAPHSVASLRQRLGRSGRRGDAAVLRVFVREPELTEKTPPPDQLRPELIQSVAMVHLLARGWYEPPKPTALHLSTLVQQVLSTIAQFGGTRAEALFRGLCGGGPFQLVSSQVFLELLRDLGDNDLVAQTHDGDLVLGLSGERLVNHYEFYSAFMTPEEFRLVTGSRTLGSIPVTYPLVLDMHLIFGGRRWRVVAVDVEKKVAELVPAGGGRAPTFGGSGAQLHEEVRREMARVYEDDAVPAFLNQPGVELLREGRDAYRRMELGRKAFVRYGEDVLYFPWAGDQVLWTIQVALIGRGVQTSNEGVALLLRGVSPADAAGLLRAIGSDPDLTALRLAATVQNKNVEKHHMYLGEDRLILDYAASRLDLDGARRVIAATVLSA